MAFFLLNPEQPAVVGRLEGHLGHVVTQVLVVRAEEELVVGLVVDGDDVAILNTFQYLIDLKSGVLSIGKRSQSEEHQAC